MNHLKTKHIKRIVILMSFVLVMAVVLSGRLSYLMIFCSERYSAQALELHQRERQIKAPRGIIYDRNGTPIAGNKSVCTISVIHSQLTEEAKVIQILSSKLEISEEEVKKKVQKKSVREKIKSNVEKAVADQIREMDLDGVMIDEDYKRYYPYDSLFSKVLGFTGADNQGIVGLEVTYDKELAGEPGSILTLTNAKGIEIENAASTRKEAVAGKDLHTSLDVNIQKYATQMAIKVRKQKNAKQVSMIILNPQNGEIYAMVNVPEYNLNEPYKVISDWENSGGSDQDKWNKMWRNTCVNDTYEPGSTFKVVTAASALEQGVVKVDDHFSCPGFRIVEDRKIRCHKVIGHGQETFKQGVMNSCNPVFIEVGLRLGADNFYKYLKQLGLFDKTGIDVPGEANSIMHKLENVGQVELATMSFGQSFQITPLQLMRAASAVVNGGNLITPHFGVSVSDKKNQTKLDYPVKSGAISAETSATMRDLLDAVVSEGSGKNAKVPGYKIGGKTATSEKLPRGNNRYISSFLGFAPSNNPSVMALLMIDEPEGVYYGGTIAAPVVGEVFSNILSYLGIEPSYDSEESTEETFASEDILD